MAKLRAARAEEAGELSALVLRSKAYWGYDERFLAGCAEELRVRAEEVAARRIVVAEDADGTVRGLASLEGEPAAPCRGSACCSWIRRPSAGESVDCCTGTWCAGPSRWGRVGC